MVFRSGLLEISVQSDGALYVSGINLSADITSEDRFIKNPRDAAKVFDIIKNDLRRKVEYHSLKTLELQVLLQTLSG